MTADNGYEVEGQLQFVSDAVLAFAHAIESIQKELCPGMRGVCPAMLAADGSKLLQQLKTIQFKGLCTNSLVELHQKKGDGKGITSLNTMKR